MLTNMIVADSFLINEFCSEFAESKLATLFAMTRQTLICILKVQGRWKSGNSKARTMIPDVPQIDNLMFQLIWI